MKAILEFNLPEELTEHLDALNGTSFRSVLIELDGFLRNKLKHGHEYKSPEEALEDVRNLLHECLFQRKIDLFDV